jgi:hypothetical protein
VVALPRNAFLGQPWMLPPDAKLVWHPYELGFTPIVAVQPTTLSTLPGEVGRGRSFLADL